MNMATSIESNNKFCQKQSKMPHELVCFLIVAIE